MQTAHEPESVARPEVTRRPVAGCRPMASPRINVAYAVPAWPPESQVSGVVSYASIMARELRAAGSAVTLLAHSVPQELWSEDVQPTIARAREGWRGRLASALRWRLHPRRAMATEVAIGIRSALRASARREPVSLVEMEEAFGFGREVSSQIDIPLVIRLHGPYFLTGDWDPDHTPEQRVERIRREGLAFQYAAGVSAPSRFVLDAVRTQYENLPQLTAVIPNPVSVPTAQVVAGGGRSAAELLFVGRFDGVKGGDTVISALAYIRAQVPDARLTFVGPDRGVLTPAGRMTSLRTWAEDVLGEAAEGLTWLGALPPERIWPLRTRAAVTIVSSRFENFPTVCLEAMAAGSPLVATNVGGTPEIVQHERNGLLCRPADPEDLAAKVVTLLRNRTLAARLGEQAALDARDRYDPAAVARQAVDFYSEVMTRWKATGRFGRRRIP